MFDLEFSPADPDVLATASYDSSVKVWEAASMRLLSTLDGPSGHIVYSLAWSRDGARIATGTGKGLVTVWDVAKRRVVWQKRHHSLQVYGIAWNALDPSLIASSAADEHLLILKADSGEEKQR